MQQVTVGTKYQIVIPKEVRKKIKGLRPGAKVSVSQIDEETVTIKARPDKTSWVERTRGIAKEAWKDIDPIAELEKMREEWEDRLKKFEKGFKSK